MKRFKKETKSRERVGTRRIIEDQMKVTCDFQQNINVIINQIKINWNYFFISLILKNESQNLKL